MPENTFKQHLDKLNIHEKIAIKVTRFIGTMGFVYLLLFFIVFWIIFNFSFSFFVDNTNNFYVLFAIITICDFMMVPLILVGQNLITKFNEIKEEIDFERNKNIEFHLLKTEVMLNRLLPLSQQQISKIEKDVDNLDEIIYQVPKDIYEMLRSQRGGESSFNTEHIIVKGDRGAFALDSLTIEFSPDKEKEILAIFKKADFPEDVNILPVVLGFGDQKNITIIYPKTQTEVVGSVIKNIFNNFKIDWDEHV